MMNLLLNVIWIVFGGLEMAFGWLVAAAVFAVSIVGIPWARAAFNMALFHLWPFGREIVDRDEMTGREDLGTGALGLLGNVVWFVLAGWWLALGHVFFVGALAITIIGIPFAWQHLKLAGMAVAPVGKMVVDKPVAAHTRHLDWRTA
ncbi:MAG TPA: YccF domain-containing protein [Acidobacteria bacterium]|jgi:uncharacterized membrane protein YccF (DUF307 family)|nr:hypothetical protein [Acidobacteriota bacterium]HAK56746.1 YccF domain-containing protein [Acidobacteriota bacterium]|tara:strand:- start:1760 stop:2200 length:441 start_codon:yes stop_codon:yes gene_type:complete